MQINIRTRPSELERMLGKVIWYIESALELDEHLPGCSHCNGTGKSPDTFDRLCPDCTAPHCVVCNAKKNLIDVMTFRLCGACEQIERRES